MRHTELAQRLGFNRFLLREPVLLMHSELLLTANCSQQTALWGENLDVIPGFRPGGQKLG